MSDPRSALPGARFDGFVTVKEAGAVGMITLRGDLGAKALVKAVKAATGAKMPDRLAITTGKTGAVAWMSPDELLLFVDHATAEASTHGLAEALAGMHALAVNVSDARAVFHVTGARARDLLAKLCPADLRGFGPGQFRRSRLAQVPAAFHMPDDASIEVICFRSVAGYMFDLLANAARPGGELD